MTGRMTLASWTRIIWLCVAFVLFGIGIGLVWWPASQEIGQRRYHASELYQEANAIDASTRRAAQLRDARLRVQEDLRQLGGIRSEGAVTAALLRLFHDENAKMGVDIREVAPDAKVHPQVVTSPAPAATPDALQGYDLAIGVRGPYRNIVSLLADLPRHDVLINLADVQITSNATERRPPVLDVTLHSSIYRIVSIPGMEGTGVRTVR